ncbi:MAG TPA: septum formation initiator family protein [Thermoanaerobaculia bacterium]|nr:septum formation initiator family protein [Thermoanaerobaculia bacterium]
MSKTQAPTPQDSFRPVVGAAVGLFIVLLAIASLKSYRDLESARARQRLLETRIEETQSRIDHLKVRIERLRTDPGTLERLAREDLGMVRPGDVVIELPLDPGTPQPARLIPPGATLNLPPGHGPGTPGSGVSRAAGSAGPPGAPAAASAAAGPPPLD